MQRFAHHSVFTMLVLLLAATVTVVAESGSGSSGSGSGGGDGGDDFKLRAQLFGDTLMSGKATYRERPRDGTIERRFKVQVEDGTPGAVMSIHVNSYFAGALQLDAFGRAEFQLRTAQFIDDPGDGQPMPADFPIVIDEDVVTVGTLSGVFFDREFSLPGNEDLVSSKYRVRSDLAGGSLMSGKAVYRERIKNGGLERRFQIELEDGPANTTFDVVVNGAVVAQVTTNGAGFVEFQFRTAAFIDDPGDGIPIPDSFPSLTAGDVVVVGPVSGTLQLD